MDSGRIDHHSNVADLDHPIVHAGLDRKRCRDRFEVADYEPDSIIRWIARPDSKLVPVLGEDFPNLVEVTADELDLGVDRVDDAVQRKTQPVVQARVDPG